MATNEQLSFFLSSTQDVGYHEFIEISHPSFSRVWRLTKNYDDGILVRHEDGNEYFYSYLPMSVTGGGVSVDLNSTLKLDFGDLGTILPQEIDRVVKAQTLKEHPKINYRVYRSDNLEQPLIGPYSYLLYNASRDYRGATLDGQAPMVNASGTGAIYTLDGPWDPLRDYIYG